MTNEATAAVIRSGARLNYVELPVVDVAVECRFFELAFGWSFTSYGEGYASSSDGGCELGITACDGDAGGSAERTASAMIGISCDDLTRAERDAVAAGGRLVRPVFEFPGGRRLELLTPGGHRLVLFRYDDAVA